MMNVKSLLGCFTILLILSSCVSDYRLRRPKAPLCIILEGKGCQCAFGTEDYYVKDCTGYLGTDPDSYGIYEKYVDSIELRLLKCLKTPKKCE